MTTLIIIPAYNEGEKIAEVIKNVKAQNFDVLVIDDGSTDNTAIIAEKAGAKVLRHLLNRGQGAALKTGIDYVLNQNYEAVVFFDADGQMQAAEINKLLAPLFLGQFEAVLGSRFLGQAKNIPVAKLITLKLALLFTRLLTGLKLTDVHNGFQAWSAGALAKINLTQDRQAHASEILNEIKKQKIKYREMPVTISYTAYSKSKGQSVFNAFNILWDLIFKR